MPAIMQVRLLRSLGNARRSSSGLRPKYCSIRHLLSIAPEPCAITWNLSIMPRSITAEGVSESILGVTQQLGVASSSCRRQGEHCTDDNGVAYP